jgi:hypothetical protein
VSSQLIANEYDYATSNIKHKVQYHGAQKYPSCNQAEYLAQNEDTIRQEKEVEKQRQIQEGMIKMKENLKLQNKKMKENKKQEEVKKQEKDEKKKKVSEYSSTLSNKIKTKLGSQKSLILENTSTINNNQSVSQIKEEESKKDIFKNSNMTNGEEDNHWTLAENHIEKSVEHPHNNTQTVNLRDDIESMIKTQLLNNCIKSKDLKQQKEDDDEEPVEQLDKLRMFRKYGKVEQNNTKTSNNKASQEEKKATEEKVNADKQSKHYQQFKKELEKRRYIKALRNIMIEKFKEKNIVIPNICSCGQLQRKLDKILESKNVSVFSVVNSECANNCIYYGKTHEYQKALSDIIGSVKNVKFENFNS